MKFLLLFVAVFHLSFALKAAEPVKINIFFPCDRASRSCRCEYLCQ